MHKDHVDLSLPTGVTNSTPLDLKIVTIFTFLELLSSASVES